ncbi:DUF4190 domain-containing protein [Microbacterium invictum]|uniref:DUF4190 domain-containing protein n=1 Tax=Microbacterium invictum TaxID=515415 RepID=A0AA40SN38_9MICO|nr:DUF4190 domain-containing protein [Microbacterium invictum]MBB4139285.1 hypothetical protein [Microbacterium invictum]
MSNPTPGNPEPGQPQPPAYGAPPQTPPYAAPGAYQPPAYPGAAPQYPGAPQYPAYGYGGYPVQKNNVLAIVSMIASILGFIWVLPFIGSLAGAIMGHISLNQLKTSGEKGRGMALAGVIVGWIGVAFAILGVLAFFAFVVATSTTRVNS